MQRETLRRCQRLTANKKTAEMNKFISAVFLLRFLPFG
jgi:hypothetical protein